MARDISASIRQRLLQVARQRKEDFNFVLRQYVLQRLMYRLGASEYANDFLLKGGLLFWVWNEDFHRPTQDMDLLGFGSDDIALLKDKFLQIIRVQCHDGLQFDPQTLQAIDIKADAKYQGVRVSGRATLAGAVVPYQVDIGFGDAVAKVKHTTRIPSFLEGLPKPELKVYPVESVIAEKFQAMVELGVLNSRMKDFFDIVTLAENVPLSMQPLQAAIQATFARRDTVIRQEPLVIFGNDFKQNSDKQKQWQAFLNKNRLNTSASFAEMVTKIQQLLEPIYQQLYWQEHEQIADAETVIKQWNSKIWGWS